MANAPTRPPGRPRSERRPPRGPRRVARTMRDRLTTAARQLEEAAATHSAEALRLDQAGDTDSAAIHRRKQAEAANAAEAVNAVLEPGGWTMLREQDAPFTTNLPLTMRASLRDALKKAAEQQNRTLTAVVAEGHRAVLDGTWKPPESKRVVRRGESATADPRAVLNVTVDDSLRKQLRDRLPALSEELGYKLTEGGIAIAYLKDKLGVTTSTGPEKGK